MSNRITLLRNSYKKIDGMVLSFGIPAYNNNISDNDVEKYFGGDLNDTLREIGLKDTESIEEMSKPELYVENRTVYYALKRFKNSASIFFKFSTAVDGKTVDKSMIPKMISEIMKEYDDEFKAWRRSSASGNIWTRTSTVATTGEVGSDS